MRRLIASFCFVALAALCSCSPVKVDEYHDIDGIEEASRRATAAASSTRRVGNSGLWSDTDWVSLANNELSRAIDVADSPRLTPAKNVIMFIGDGMGMSTISAARLWNAENNNLMGEDSYLSWETFAHLGFSRTYNVDRSTSDSAGTATAYLCGVKANMGTIGVTDQVQYGNCSAVSDDTIVRSALKESIAAGKWTGVVTTTRVTHASPAASYAHVSNRNWEAYMPRWYPSQVDCDDIAKQLIRDEENSQIRVILGGGRRSFVPMNVTDYDSEGGYREDNIDLIKEWINKHTNGEFVMDRAAFENIDPHNTHYLMGLFSLSHMDYETDRVKK